MVFFITFFKFFEILANAFVKEHAGARKVQPRKEDLFKIALNDSKLLREFTKGSETKQNEDNNQYFQSTEKSRSDRCSDRPQSNISILNRDSITASASGVSNIEAPRLSKCYFNVDLVRMVAAIRHMKDNALAQDKGVSPSTREVARLLEEGYLRVFLRDRAKRNYGRSRDVE
ncbi:hypothetical protein HAX54_032834 [Datura stramonium]|uniref:Uncharacterized protein n=1 Tax=Datura stramonium TaxID=4076 RepID=A0ABS8VBZ2_DATST|nr:hypothetical protein [Datura stramonium]